MYGIWLTLGYSQRGFLRIPDFLGRTSAVGDVVDFELEENEEFGLIKTIHDRQNYIIRKSVNLSKQVQIIASNMDQALLVASLKSPSTPLGFIDRGEQLFEPGRLAEARLGTREDIAKRPSCWPSARRTLA